MYRKKSAARRRHQISCGAAAFFGFMIALGSVGGLDCGTLSLAQGARGIAAGLTVTFVFGWLYGRC